MAGGAGVLLSPTIQTAWTAAMLGLLQDSGKREKLRLKGIEQAKKFPWRKTAQETLEVYKRALMI